MTPPSAKAQLTPKLRFPEFRDAGEWIEKQVGEVFKVTRGEVLSMALVQDEKTSEAQYPVYSSQTKNSGLSGYYKDFLYENAITWTTDGANAGDVNYRSGKFYCTNVCGVLINDEGYANPCIAALINSVSRNHVSYVGNPKLMNGVMAKIAIPFPSVKEQHKIASCLSSLDDLIAAERQKLDALKAHKKVLMQQLFPREGETRPRLRFPEFRKGGEWREKLLGDLGQLVSGLTYSPDDVRDDGLLVLRSSNIQNGKIDLNDCVFVDPSIRGANLSRPDDILICVRNGSKTLIGKNALIPSGLPVCTHGAFMTVFRSPSAQFVFQLFQSPGYQKQVAADLGATINSINGSQFLRYRFYVPEPSEQQKITALLGSLDDLIAAQDEKVEALKTHKKGLMQQLFPSLEQIEP